MIPLSSIKKEQKPEKQINIDLNCDLGQSFGVYKNEQELELLQYVSSVNISCGSHAGDPLTIMNMLKLASENNLTVGAHVGYPDIQGFGYRNMNLNDEEIQALVVYQIGALNSLAKLYNLTVEHVRPHGAMYVEAAKNYKTSLAIAKAVAKYDPWLIYVGAPGENLLKAGEETNLRVAQEVQLDKKYAIDGTVDFEAGDIVDLEYSTRLLETLVRDSSVINNQQGRTKLEIKTVHLSVKSAVSIELAQKAKALISNPIPIIGTYVAENGWL
ncbi:MAG: LamB/YcsF family protein [bacterium]